MLRKKYCLKKKKDFERVFKQGKGFRQDFLFLKTLKNDLENSRIGIVVSKKVSSKATERNLIKRRLREIIRKKLPEMNNNEDIIIITQKGINKKTSFENIEQVVDKLLLKAKIR
jgi:ribonuclease P protein component